MKKASARKAEAINFIQLSNTAVSQGILLPLVAERLNLTHFIYKMYCVVFVVF